MARELALHYLPMIGDRYTPQVYLEKANYMEAVFFCRVAKGARTGSLGWLSVRERKTKPR